MPYNFSPLKAKTTEIKDWLSREFSGIRTGRATPAILDSVMVESYGSRVPLKQVAAIGVEDAKTLRVAPWDKSQIKAIETGIAIANLGVSTAPDSESIRVVFPSLTEERRNSLIKIIKEKLEDARISLRKERDEVWTDIQNQAKDKKISEDDKFHFKDELQKLIDSGSREFEDLATKKEKEILA